MTTRLIIVDDQPLVREALRYLLESTGSFRVIGEIANTEEAFQLILELMPDLAVLDIGSRGIELTSSLRKAHPSIAILILTMFDNDECVVRAIRAGANGYVLKNSPVKQIITAIEIVASGGTCYGSAATRSISRESFRSPLSRREREVLAHIVKGYSNKETARLLNISVRTIESHRQTIRRKLGAKRSVELVSRAFQMGLIDI